MRLMINVGAAPETNGFELTMTNEEIVGLFLAIACNSLRREQN